MQTTITTINIPTDKTARGHGAFYYPWPPVNDDDLCQECMKKKCRKCGKPIEDYFPYQPYYWNWSCIN
jgi:hypothetical protein